MKFFALSSHYRRAIRPNLIMFYCRCVLHSLVEDRAYTSIRLPVCVCVGVCVRERERYYWV